MNPPGNSAGGETPPSSQNQTQLHRPGQTDVAANNELHIINEPSQPLNDAGGRGAPPSLPRPLEIEQPRPQRAVVIEEYRLRHYLTYQEYPSTNEPFLTPHCTADGRRTQPSPSSQRQFGIQDPGQPLSRVNNESLNIRQPSHRLHSAKRTRLNLQASIDQYILRHQQQALRVNQESHIFKKPSPPLYSTGQRTSSQALKDQPLQYQKHAPRVNQESHTMKKLSSSSEDRRGGVVAHRCAKCNNTSTTQWRSDPTGQTSLCNACGIRLNREEETRAASGLQSSNISSAELRRYLEEERNREPMENNANPFVPENNFLRHSSAVLSSNVVSPPPAMSPPAAPSLANSVQLVENISGLQSPPPLRDPPEEASEMEGSEQNWTDETRDNSPEA